MNPIGLSPEEMDALNELGNVATGNAATALSKLLTKPVEMNIPNSRFIPLGEFADVVGGAEQLVSAIYLSIDGDFCGEALFVFPEAGALELTDLTLGNTPGTTSRIMAGTMEESAFKEIANILTGSFLNATAKMLDAKILPSIAHVATDMAQSLIDFLLVKIGAHADEIYCVETRINVEGHNINGEFLVLFDRNSLKRMLEILHNRYGGIID